MFSSANRNYDLDVQQNGPPKKATKMRFFVCILGLMSLVLTQMSRMVLNVSIVSMVDPSMIQAEGSVSNGGSCPKAEVEEKHESVFQMSIEPLAEEDSISSKMFRSNELYANSTARPADLSLDVPRYKWTIKEQSTILGGFFYSYFLFMVLGARLSEIYGAKYVIMLGVAGSAIITLLTPWMASQNFYLLVISRIVMGAIQSGVFPSLFALINRWLTMSEASIFAPLTKMNFRFGMLAASLLPGFVPKWPNVFYIAGACGLLWSVLWFFLATSEPKDNFWVNETELAHIIKKKKKKIQFEDDKDGETKVSNKSTPWLKIILNPTVIAFVIIKTTFNFGTVFLTVFVPSYLKYVHHASRQTISGITSGLFLIQVLLCVVIGWLAKTMIKKRPFGLSRTGVRIFFQTIASGGSGLLFVLITFNNCNLTYTAVALQLLAVVGVFTAGGETVLPYDLSEEYPATILAIANSLSNLTAISIPILVGLILNDQGGSSYRWNIIMYLIGGSNLLGSLIFALLVKAEPIDL